MLPTSFILLTIAISALIFTGIFSVTKIAYSAPYRRKINIYTVIVLSGWLTYTTILSLNSVFTSTSLPPRVPLLLTLPAFTFTAFFFLSGRFRRIIDNTPAHWLIYFQTFRIIVELLLLKLFLNNMIPREATFEGYNFDILIGISAPVMGWLAYSKKIIGRRVLTLWNICGLMTLAVVVFVFMTHAYVPQIWHKHENILNEGFGLFPYTFLAGFLMPCAVFMHIFSLVKLKRKETSAHSSSNL